MTLAAWSSAVGRRLARKTRATGVREGTLIVEVEDELWRRNLAGLEKHILQNLAQTLGQDRAPLRIEFRLGVPRRPMKMAEPPQPAIADEADRIADPVLSYLYRQSRRKAGA